MENAIKHGIEPQVRAGLITLRARPAGPDRLIWRWRTAGSGSTGASAGTGHWTPTAGPPGATVRRGATLDLLPGSDRGCGRSSIPTTPPPGTRFQELVRDTVFPRDFGKSVDAPALQEQTGPRLDPF